MAEQKSISEEILTITRGPAEMRKGQAVPDMRRVAHGLERLAEVCDRLARRIAVLEKGQEDFVTRPDKGQITFAG